MTAGKTRTRATITSVTVMISFGLLIIVLCLVLWLLHKTIGIRLAVGLAFAAVVGLIVYQWHKRKTAETNDTPTNLHGR